MSKLSSAKTNSLQGADLPALTAAERQAALDAAFDYRGDVTLHLHSGEAVEGYLFSRDHGLIKMYVKGSDQPREFSAQELVRISFSGKDPADGKSYENWKSKKETERRAEAEKVAAELQQQGYL